VLKNGLRNMIQKLINIILYPYRAYVERRQLKKRLEELRKRDPFIYK
jgi:hypothetical protein